MFEDDQLIEEMYPTPEVPIINNNFLQDGDSSDDELLQDQIQESESESEVESADESEDEQEEGAEESSDSDDDDFVQVGDDNDYGEIQAYMDHFDGTGYERNVPQRFT